MYRFTIWYNLQGCGYDLKKKTKVATVKANNLEDAKKRVCEIIGEYSILVVKYNFEEVKEQIKGGAADADSRENDNV